MPSGRDIKAGRAYVELGTNDSRLVRGLKRAQQRIQRFGAALTKVGVPVAAALAAATAKFVSFGDALDKAAARTGVSVEALSTLRFAAEQSGASLEELETALRNMARTVTSGESKLAALGLSIEDLQGLNPDEQFKRIADELSRVEDPSNRAALAMEVFGEQGQRLIPLLAGGRRAIEALQQEARSLGLQVSTEDATAAASLGDAWNRVKSTLLGAVVAIGSALAPMLTEIANRVAAVIRVASEWINQNRGLTIALALVSSGIAALGFAALTVAGIVSVLTFVTKGFTVALTVLTAHPIVAVLTAIAALLTLVALKFFSAKSAANSFKDQLRAIQKEAAAGVQAQIEREQRRLAPRFDAGRNTVKSSSVGTFNPFAAGRLSGVSDNRLVQKLDELIRVGQSTRDAVRKGFNFAP